MATLINLCHRGFLDSKMLSIPLADRPWGVRRTGPCSWLVDFFVLCRTALFPLLLLGLQGSACVGPQICSYHGLCNGNSAVNNCLMNQCNESMKDKLLVSMKVKCLQKTCPIRLSNNVWHPDIGKGGGYPSYLLLCNRLPQI